MWFYAMGSCWNTDGDTHDSEFQVSKTFENVQRILGMQVASQEGENEQRVKVRICQKCSEVEVPSTSIISRKNFAAQTWVCRNFQYDGLTAQ
jgi:hypothetical protein